MKYKGFGTREEKKLFHKLFILKKKIILMINRTQLLFKERLFYCFERK